MANILWSPPKNTDPRSLKCGEISCEPRTASFRLRVWPPDPARCLPLRKKYDCQRVTAEPVKEKEPDSGEMQLGSARNSVRT